MSLRHQQTIHRLLLLQTKAELKEIAGRIDILLVDSRKVETSDFVHDLVVGALGKGFPPPSVTRRSKQFQRGAKELLRFEADVLPNLGRKRKQVLQKVVDCVITDLKKQDYLPVCPKTVGTWLGKVYEVAERAFPDYMQCGLLRNALTMERSKWEASPG